VSTHPLRTPAYAWGLLRFIRASRTFLADNPSSEPTLGEWFETHPLGARFAREVLLPWLASLTSSNVETLTTQSMRAFLVLFAPAFPRGVFDAPSTFCSRIGLGGIVRMLADRCANLSVHLNAPVTRLERVHSGRATDGWFVETAAGRFGPYEHVVVNAPPYAAREFLTGATEALRDILGRYTYYAARMVIHEDPRYMPASQRDWCMHNAAVDGEICEATFWLGAYRTDPATGAPLRLFKSWATHRAAEPDAILAEREFRHLLLTPGALHAARELQRHQGVDGLHFVGHATTLTDLQETALWSAMKVAETLAPASPRLRPLQRRATQAGHAELDYRP